MNPLVPIPAFPPGHKYRQIGVTRVAGACGAEVSGIDLATELHPEGVAEIRRALLDHQVVFFRDQRLDPDAQDDSATQTQVHPVVREHGETGAPALFVNAQYTVGLHGNMSNEAKPLLDVLFAHSTRTDLTCRWQWRVGDVAMWENRAVQHMAMADFSGHRRAMHRTTVAGEAPRRPGPRPDSRPSA